MLKPDYIKKIAVAANASQTSVKEVLAKYGSLDAVMQADDDSPLVNRIRAIVAVGRMLVLSEVEERGNQILGSANAYQYLAANIGRPMQEEFYVLGVDASNRPVYLQKVAVGSVTEVHVSAACAFKAAIVAGVSRMILCHNHPSGEVNPSASDQRLTDRFVEVGRMFEIEVLDHIILGDGKFYSFADHGRI